MNFSLDINMSIILRYSIYEIELNQLQFRTTKVFCLLIKVLSLHQYELDEIEYSPFNNKVIYIFMSWLLILQAALSGLLKFKSIIEKYVKSEQIANEI